METLFKRLIYKLKGLYTRLFIRPDIKVGECLSYHGYISTGYYFNWEHYLWVITTKNGFAISSNLELWYRNHIYKNYCKSVSSYPEPDYNVHIDDPKENRVRIMTFDEFVKRVKKDGDFAKMWINN